MSEIATTLLVGLFIALVGCGAFLVGQVLYFCLWKWPKEDGKRPFGRLHRFFHQDRIDRTKPSESKQVRYCHSCGARAIVWSYQYGFNPKTGAASYHTFLCCPDWNEINGRSRAMFSTYDADEVGACENIAMTPMAALITHTGHVDGDVSVNCKRCIIDMERADIISHEDADARLKEIA